MKTLGQNIKRLRLSRGLTQPQLADIVGASSYTTVSKWESGANSPKGKDLVRLSEYFNVSVDELLGIKSDGLITVSSQYDYIPTSISAGNPLNVEGVTREQVEKISIPDVMMGKWAGSKDVFLMRVNGESMNNMFSHNSLIAVKKTPLTSLHNGDIVVYSDSEEYAVKRIIIDNENKRFIFRPDSSDARFVDNVIAYDEANNLRIHGKVVLYIVELD